jgi:hypothetical protein
MKMHADRVIADILHAEDRFLIEVGRLTLLFSRIEDCLVDDARQLAELSEDEKLKEEAAAPAIVSLRKNVSAHSLDRYNSLVHHGDRT